MKPYLSLVFAIGGALLFAQVEPPRDWRDPDTGHHIVRLDAAGGSTLYFPDNAFSPEGDRLMFTPPDGTAVVDVAKIGSADLKPEIVARGRGGYFARRSREIYFTSAGSVSAVNVDTKQVRELTHARGLINSNETLSVAKNASAKDPEG